MSDVLTIAEIEAQFIVDWVLVDEPQTNEALEVQSGKVLAHSKYRDEVYREAVRFGLIVVGATVEGPLDDVLSPDHL